MTALTTNPKTARHAREIAHRRAGHASEEIRRQGRLPKAAA
jgi:hypothetical protein